MSNGDLPVLFVEGRTLAEAWERSLVELWKKGCRIRTDYDRKDRHGNYIDPPSVDASMCMIVREPFGDPMIHRSFPAALEDLEEYRMEVVEGIKDHWVRDKNDPEDTRWEYTYHGRLFAYDVPGLEGAVDQIEGCIMAELCRSEYSRRANAITWQPWYDPKIEHPPCLQSIWCRLVRDEAGALKLAMNIRFRSRDAYDAAFMNMFALVHLQKEIADRLSKRLGEKVEPGRYVDWSDSYHIYGRRLEDFERRFLAALEKRSFEERTWTLEFAREAFLEARERIMEKVREMDRRFEEEKKKR